MQQYYVALICFYVGHIICITTVRWLNVLWHIASCLSRWFWSPAGERIYIFLQLRASWERTSRRRWVELTECSREAAGSRVPTGFVFHRHEDIDPAAPCLPPGPQPGWSCWRRTQRTRLINWLLDWWENGGILIQVKNEGNKRWMEMLRLQLRKSTSLSRLYLAIFRFVWVWVGVSVFISYTEYNVNCASLFITLIFLLLEQKKFYLQCVIVDECVCVRVSAGIMM